MEESGHYYTVYFTSLAVGFNEQVAYIHALLAQMPDEVGWLDAANMHKRQCLGIPEYDLGGYFEPVLNEDRFSNEYGIHALPDMEGGNTSSRFQRSVTQKLLLAEDPLSLKFGLLLHRLGDTYAHSVIGNEDVMYTSASYEPSACGNPKGMGHFIHLHKPDYPFLRQSLFYQYLTALYKVLIEKRNDEAYLHADSFLVDKTVQPKLLEELLSIFKEIFKSSYYFSYNLRYKNDINPERIRKITPKSFIDQIIEKARKYLSRQLKPYRPELIESQTLEQFLSEVSKGALGTLFFPWIDEMKIIEARESILEDLRKAENDSNFQP